MNRERIVQVFFFAFLLAITYELYQVIEPFIEPIAWAILLAFLVHPALTHLQRLVRSRTSAALLLTVIVALGILLPAAWLSARIVSEAQSLYAQVSAFQKQGGIAHLDAWLLHTRLGTIVARELGRLGVRLQDQVRNGWVQGAKVTSEYVITHGGQAASNLASFLFHFGIAMLVFFYLLRDGEFYYNTLRALTPLHDEEKAAIFDTLRTTLSAVMRGLMLTAALDGLTIGAGYLVCGAPFWAFLAVLTAACGLLPLGGTAIVWVPVALYLGFAVSWTQALILAIWATVAVAIIDNFVKPLAMRHGTGLSTVALFLGLAGGLEAYGPIGIFAGPAVVAVFAAVIRVYQRNYAIEPAPVPTIAPLGEATGATADPVPSATPPEPSARAKLGEES